MQRLPANRRAVLLACGAVSVASVIWLQWRKRRNTEQTSASKGANTTDRDTEGTTPKTATAPVSLGEPIGRACNGLESMFVQMNVRFAAVVWFQPSSPRRVHNALQTAMASAPGAQLIVSSSGTLDLPSPHDQWVKQTEDLASASPESIVAALEKVRVRLFMGPPFYVFPFRQSLTS